jgi:hypothetical protein
LLTAHAPLHRSTDGISLTAQEPTLLLSVKSDGELRVLAAHIVLLPANAPPSRIDLVGSF